MVADSSGSERWKAINASIGRCQTVVVSRREEHVGEELEGKVKRDK